MPFDSYCNSLLIRLQQLQAAEKALPGSRIEPITAAYGYMLASLRAEQRQIEKDLVLYANDILNRTDEPDCNDAARMGQ